MKWVVMAPRNIVMSTEQRNSMTVVLLIVINSATRDTGGSRDARRRITQCETMRLLAFFSSFHGRDRVFLKAFINILFQNLSTK